LENVFESEIPGLKILPAAMLPVLPCKQNELLVFTHSRVPIAALTLGTAIGAFELALDVQKLVICRELMKRYHVGQ